MATYVRSTDGNDTDDGSTWALAKATIAAANIGTINNVAYVSQNHSESSATSVTLAFYGASSGYLSQLIGCIDSAEPPTTLSSSPMLSTTGATTLTITGFAYIYGVKFNIGSGAGNSYIKSSTANGTVQTYQNCDFILGASGTSGNIYIGDSSTTSGGTTTWIDCNVKFASSYHRILTQNTSFYWKGGSFLAGGVSPTYIFNPTQYIGYPLSIVVENVDFSNLDPAVKLVNTNQGNQFTCIFKNCKLPANWTGTIGSYSYPGCRAELHNCDSANTNYRLWTEDKYGFVKSETTIIRPLGASDGTTNMSWVMSSNFTTYPMYSLLSPTISIWNDVVGVSQTVTVEFIHDVDPNITVGRGSGTNYAFRDNEVWLEVVYLGDSNSPKGSLATNKPDVLTAPTDHPLSSATWTTTGMVVPMTQKLSVSFTAQKKGYIQVKVALATANKKLYIDPLITVS